MRTLIWIIAIFALAAGVAMLAGANDGYLLIVFPPWRAQVSLNLAIVVLVFGFALAYTVLRLVSKAMDLPGRVGVFRARRQQDKAFRSLRDAVQALFEGHFTESLKQAKVAYATGGESPVAALVAARAAHGLNDERRYREWIDKAAGHKDVRIAGLLTGAELALDAGDVEAAGKTLDELRADAHRSTVALRMELEVAQARGDWPAVLECVRRLEENRAIVPEQARRLVREAHARRLAELASEPTRQLAYWRELPREVTNDAELVRRAVAALAAGGQAAVARKTVERVLDAGWDSELARCYAACAGQGEEATDALARAERWLPAHAEDPGLLYSLGRQCMDAQIWGKAQAYLEQSLRGDARAEVLMALGELMEKLDRPADATAYYRKAARAGLRVGGALVPVGSGAPGGSALEVKPSRVA